MGCGASVEQKRIALERSWFEASASGDVSTIRQIQHLPQNFVNPKEEDPEKQQRIVHVNCLNTATTPKVDGESTKHWTALLIAASSGLDKVVKELLEHECDVNIDVSRGSTGTALSFAAEKYDEGENYQAIVKMLLAEEAHTIANLLHSGVASRAMSEAAADLIFKEAIRRGFDPAIPVEGVTEFHLKRYNQWAELRNK